MNRLSELLDAALAWASVDPDPANVAALHQQIDRAQSDDDAVSQPALDELADQFSGQLSFGTAGLRAAEGPGPRRMNRIVVAQTSAGLAQFLTSELGTGQTASSGHTGSSDPSERATHLENSGQPARPPRVVIGFDARTGSASFAQQAAAVMTAAGVETLVFDRHLPTPLLAYAVRHCGADSGVMITASHNPAADNGYKVYVGSRITGTDAAACGAQIAPPLDQQITEHINVFRHAPAELRPELLPPQAPAGSWHVLDTSVLEAYQQGAVDVLRRRSDRGDQLATHQRAELSIVYTPLHGVGGLVVPELLQRVGFNQVHPVVEQITPDPQFPTVQFPNPEEPGALDLAKATALKHDADLVLANDPDADRLAVAVPDNVATGSFRALTGDELGLMLGAHLRGFLEKNRLCAANSFVSSTMLQRYLVAGNAHNGQNTNRQNIQRWQDTPCDWDVPHEQTLTGFKWLARVENLGFAYEEALGYCVAPEMVRDKDGITAALVVADLAAKLKAEGSCLAEYLRSLQAEIRPSTTAQVSLRLADQQQITDLVEMFRHDPPHEIASLPVASVTDYAPGAEGLPPTNAVRVLAQAAHAPSDHEEVEPKQTQLRVMVRPSGTEPKIKFYLECIADDDATASAIVVAAGQQLAQLS